MVLCVNPFLLPAVAQVAQMVGQVGQVAQVVVQVAQVDVDSDKVATRAPCNMHSRDFP